MKRLDRLFFMALHNPLGRIWFNGKETPPPADPISEPGADEDNAKVPVEKVNLTALMGRIQACTGVLARACERVDKPFLGIGNSLQTIYDQSDELTRMATDTVAEMGDASGDNALVRVTQTAGTALDELMRKQSRIQANLDQVSTMGEQLTKLQPMGHELSRIARFLKMVGMNISIESSRSDDAQTNFVALSREIRELAVSVSEMAREFKADSAKVHTRLTAMHQEMHTKLGHFQQLAAVAKSTIQETVPEVQAIIGRSVAAVDQVGRNAQAIAQSVTHIVVSMQIHDNVSQRVAHIVDALAMDRQTAPSSMTAPEDEDKTAEAALRANLSLQIAQLEKVVEDVKNAYRVSVQAFDTIGQTVMDNMQLMSEVETDQSACKVENTIGSNSVDALKKTLKEIHAMIGCGNDTVSELQEITRSATTIVSRIEQHMAEVGKVNFDIHLRSLNAMFKSLRLGSKGKAIEALVQEMKAVATQSGEFVGQVEGISSVIQAAASTLEDSFDTTCEITSPDQETDHGDLETGIDAFINVCATFKAKAATTIDQAHGLSERVTSTVAELGFVEGFAEELTTQLEALKQLRQEIAPPGGNDAGFGAAAHDHLVASYTMQQERDIHLQLMQQSADARPTDTDVVGDDTRNVDTTGGQTASSGAAADDGFDDNIELF